MSTDPAAGQTDSASDENRINDEHGHSEQNTLSEQHERPRGIVAKALVGIVRGYQMVVSPWFAPRCRYYPSCSQYAVVAVSKHGVWRGTWMAAWRLLRCNPWSLGGVDHVPEHVPGARTLIDSPPVSSARPHRDRGGPDQT